MVTLRNDSIELAVVKEKYPAPSAPAEEEFVGRTKRSPHRKRCWTVVTLVVVLLVAIGTGTILFYEHLLGLLPAESNGHGPRPEVSEGVPSLVDRGPVMIDPYPDESVSRSTPSATEVIFIDSTTDGSTEEQIFIDSKEESAENSSAEDRATSDEDHERSSSGDDVTESRDSGEEMSYEEASGSGDGSGDGRE